MKAPATTGVDSHIGTRRGTKTASSAFTNSTRMTSRRQRAMGVRSENEMSVVSASLRPLSGCRNAVVTPGWFASQAIHPSSPRMSPTYQARSNAGRRMMNNRRDRVIRMSRRRSKADTTLERRGQVSTKNRNGRALPQPSRDQIGTRNDGKRHRQRRLETLPRPLPVSGVEVITHGTVEDRGEGVVEEAEVEWLWHVTEGAALQRFGGERHLLVGGDHDHGDRIVELLDGLQHLDAAHAGHLDVEEDHIGSLATDRVERIDTVERDLHVVVDLEVLAENLQHQRFIVHDEHSPARRVDHPS